MKTLFLSILLMTVLTMPAARALDDADRERLRDHTIATDKEGCLVEPDNERREIIDPTTRSNFIQRVINKALIPPASGPGSDSTVRRIALFVHGGLNTESTRQKRVLELTDPSTTNDLAADFLETHHPVFINWSSGPFSSYGEHLMSVTQGERVTGRIAKPFRRLSFPFYLAADLGSAAARAPLTLMKQANSDAKIVDPPLTPDIDREQQAEERYRQMRKLFLQSSLTSAVPAVECGTDRRSHTDAFKYNSRYVVSTPVRLPITTLVDGTGKSAWENLLRRTQTLFRHDDDFARNRHREFSPFPRKPQGALSIFAEQALKTFSEHTNVQYELVLYGHSMGAIIINEFLVQYAHRLPPNVKLTKIVYMAAACTVGDFLLSVVPSLQRHQDAHFYNLSLHPTNERLESNAFDLSNRGSLLVWIDTYYARPRSTLDLTLGRFENILRCAHLIPENLMPRVTLKAFGVNGNSRTGKPFGGAADQPHQDPEYLDVKWRANPQKHGDFGLAPFHTKSFQTVKKTGQ